MPVRIILGIGVTVIGFGDRRPAVPLALPAHPGGQARPLADAGQHRPQGGGRGHRGGRSAQAPAVDGARPGPLLHHVGLHHPAAHHHRGLRLPLRHRLPHSRHRHLELGRLRRGLLRLRRPPRAHHLLHHPPDAGAPAPRAQVALLRLPHRRRLAGPPHDRRRHHHAAPLPRRPDQHRAEPVPLRPRRLRLPRRRPRAAPARFRRQLGARHRLPHPQHRDHLGLHRLHRLLQAPAHLHWRPSTSPSPAAPAPSARWAARPTWTWRTSTRTPCSAWARSASSPGSRCSTSPPAPSAGAASRRARPGPPRSRCRPSSSS